MRCGASWSHYCLRPSHAAPGIPAAVRQERRAALEGLLFVLRTGIGWNALPKALGFGCGSACHHRLVEWNDAGVWAKLHPALIKKLADAKQIDWRRAVVDASSVRAVFGGTKWAPQPDRPRQAG